MKHTISYFVLLAALLLAGCAADELPGGDPGSNAPTVPTVSVSDNGYAPATAATAATAPTAATSSDTRAVENGYRTEFTAGDRIGFFAVKNQSVVPGCKNVCLTATATDDGGLVWTGDAWYAGSDATYYAYYPYQEDSYLEQNGIDPTATTAEAFFARGIAAWTPAADQRDYATGYTASDLMVGRGILGVNGSTPTLAVGLTHQMSLAVVEFPRTIYQFTNTPALADYTVPAPGIAFDAAAQPYTTGDGTFRYLVNPAAATATTLAGSYDGGQRLFSFAASEIAAGAFRTYKIDGATRTTQSYTLQEGDSYLNDGSLIAKGTALTAEQQAACLGTVVKVGRDESDDCNYKQKSGAAMPAVRAYVLASRNANGGYSCTWGFDVLVDHPDMDRSESAFSGYKNTQAIIAFNGDSGELQANFPATYYATADYETRYPSPASSCGWFLPSAGQYLYCANSNYLSLEVENGYWSSSESGADWAFECFLESYGDYDAGPSLERVTVQETSKVATRRVRPALVF